MSFRLMLTRPVVVLAALSGLCGGCSSRGSARPLASTAAGATSPAATSSFVPTPLRTSSTRSTTHEADRRCDGTTPTQIAQTFVDAVVSGDHNVSEDCFLGHGPHDVGALARLAKGRYQMAPIPRHVFPPDAITIFGISSACDPVGMIVTVEKDDSGDYHVTSVSGVTYDTTPGGTTPTSATCT